MRRLIVLSVAVLSVTLAAALHARAGAATSPTGFRTPDAGAACRLERAALICSSLGSPASVALSTHSAPAIVHAPPWWDASTPVVRSFHAAGLSCRLTGAALICRGAGAAVRVDGAGFAIAS